MQKIRLIVATLILLMSVAGTMAQERIGAVLSGEDFTTLVSLVVASGMELPQDVTVFAPTNDAFAALPTDVVEFIAGNPDVLNRVLSYHIVDGVVADGENETLQGGSVIVDGMTVDGVNITDSIEVSNGTVKVIDAVLIPDVELPAIDPLDYSGGSIVAAGSSTVFPLSERMAEVWTDYGGIPPSIESIGSGAGFERFCVAGETDISNASRAIKESEVESCNSIERTPIEFRVGTDALAVTVSAENNFVTDVTMEEVAMIFSSADTWADVRAEWPTEPIQRFIPGTDSGTFDYFVEAVFDKDEEPILSAANTQLSEDDNVLVQGIQASPYAIGFFGYAYYLENAATLNILNINSIEPNAASAEDGTYPLARPLFLYSDAQILADKPEVAAFLNFVLTNVNDEIVGVGYFPASSRALNLARLGWLAGVSE